MPFMTGKAGNPCVTWPFSLLRDVCEKPETGAQGIQAVNGTILWAPLLEKQALMTHCFFIIKELFIYLWVLPHAMQNAWSRAAGIHGASPVCYNGLKPFLRNMAVMFLSMNAGEPPLPQRLAGMREKTAVPAEAWTTDAAGWDKVNLLKLDRIIVIIGGHVTGLRLPGSAIPVFVFATLLRWCVDKTGADSLGIVFTRLVTWGKCNYFNG